LFVCILFLSLPEQTVQTTHTHGQVVVDAPNEAAAVRAVLVAAAAEGARLREEGVLGPVVAGGAGGELVQHNNLSS
jgi:hypothetical protein